MESTEERIWNWLKGVGFSDCGAAGLMGNLYAESGLNPKNLQNSYEKKLGYTDSSYTAAVDSGTYTAFATDGAGYGLAQWTYRTRKAALLAYCKAAGASIGDLDTQIGFLLKELYGSYSKLAEALEMADDVETASNAVLLQFEKPADQSDAVKAKRAGYSKGYYDKYASKGGEAKMTNSSLVSYTKLSPNNSGTRNHVIDTVSIHCMAGNLSVESCGDLFAKPATRASSNYGIGSDGRIALYVSENDRSWCTSNSANDNRAVTIEVANTKAADPWPVSDAAYESLIQLLVDICQRNGIDALRWKGDKSLIGQVDKQNMTVHRWFAAKSCPGDWLYERHGQIAEEVNRRLNANTKATVQTETEDDEDMTLDRFKELMKEYRAELQDNDCGSWSQEAREWAISSGMITGMGTDANGDVNYAWADQLTREQAAALFYRFAKLLGQA
jgi:N-acetyl-anhydromuramyl-L-alanine amidase AmpD